MGRSAAFDDVTGMGRSKIVPFREGEPPMMRHDRRREAAVRDHGLVADELHTMALTLKISNYGHHWKITGENFLAQWWPSSAKLVFGNGYNRGVHCHDRQQLVAAIRERLTRGCGR